MGFLKKTAKSIKKQAKKFGNNLEKHRRDVSLFELMVKDPRREAAAMYELSEEQAAQTVAAAQDQANQTAEASRAAVLQLQTDQTRANMANDQAKSKRLARDGSPVVELGGGDIDAGAVLKRRNQFRPARRQ